MANNERRAQTNFDFRTMTPEQKASFIKGFEAYMANKRNGKAVVNGAKEYLGLDGAKIDPMKNYIEIVDQMRKFRTAAARRRAQASTDASDFRQTLKAASPEVIWSRLTRNAQIKVIQEASKGLSAAQIREYQNDQAAWQQVCQQKAKDMLDDLAVTDFADRTPIVDDFTKFKDSLKDAEPNEVWKRLTRNGQVKVWQEANKDIKSREEQAEYERNPEKWQQACEQKAKNMLNDGQLEANDFNDITPYVKEEEVVQPEPTPDPRPTDTRHVDDLFEREAKPFIDAHRPAMKKARNRAIWQTALGVLSLAFGLDIAVSTFAVVPMAAALTGALLPVIALSGLGFVGIAFGAANIVKAARHSRLFRHLTNAYTQRNRRGVRLSRAMVEKSILKSRRLADILGYDRQHLSVLNQGTYVYTPITTRMKNGIVKQGAKVKKGAKRMNKKRVLWARDRKETKALAKEYAADIKERKERQNRKIKQAERAKKIYEREERTFDGRFHTVYTPEEADKDIRRANIEKRRLAVEESRNAKEIAEKKKTDKDARRIKTLSDEKKQRLLREFKASMTEEERREFNNKTPAQRKAQVMAYLQDRVNNKKRATPAAPATSTSTDSATDAHVSTM